jgi:hypothetical protein
MRPARESSGELELANSRFFSGGMLVVTFLAAAKFLFHLYFNNRYDYFRDEFNYIACGNHLAWGYVDHPPLIPFLLKLCRIVFGDSLRSIRLIPAVAASIIVVQAAMIARELGGKRFALILTAVTIVAGPIFLADGSLMTTNCLEPLLWMGCVHFAILAIKRSEPRYWVWFGVCAGIGLEEKYSIGVLGFAMVVGLLLTEHRRVFASKWIYVGGAMALLLFLPNLLWNVQHHWPFFELMRNIKADGRDVVLSPLGYFAQQILIMLPLAAPIWIAGVFAFLFSAKLRPWRFLGWTYLAAFTVFVVLKGKNYYLTPIYPVYFAAGAVVFEGFVERARQMWMKPVTVALLLANGAWFAPAVVPIVPAEKFLSYLQTLPFKLPRSEHSHERVPLPQHFADQFGWREMVDVVNLAYSKLSPEERPGCGIIAQNYGQAGAIDFLGRRYGLPPAISAHQTYFLWGTHGFSGNCMIVLDDRREVLQKLFEEVEYVGSSDNPYALEGHIPVFICRKAKFGSLDAIWPKQKKWR